MNSRGNVVLGLLLVPALLLTGCGGSEDDPTAGRSTEEVLTLAKKQFDEASSVHMTLSTEERPTSGDAVLGAEGTLTQQPGFDGQVTVVLGGFNADVPVIAIDGKVYAKLPLTPRYAVIDPAEYGAPDPAAFADPDRGISGLLLQLEDPRKAGRKRDGSEVLTTYEGTLAGDLVAPIIPSADASGSYATTVGIDSEGRIVSLRVTGEFFAHDGPVTYDLELDDYGKAVTVAAP